jgi:fructokinase
VAAQRFGVSATVCTQLSTDLFGDGLLAHLSGSGVDTSYITRHDRASSLAFIVESDGDAHFQFIGDGSADRFYDPQPRPNLPDDIRFISLSPLTSFGEPAHTANLDIVRAHRTRATIVLDPTVRPALFRDPAQWHRLFAEILPLVHIVKGSDQDLEWLYPERSVDASAAAWATMGPAAVIVTRGGDGADLHRAGHPVLHVDAPKVTVIDTVGAGDTFSGSLMAQLALAGHGRDDVHAYQDELWRTVLHHSAAAAAINCSRAGCNPPTPAEVDAFLGKTRGQ